MSNEGENGDAVRGARRRVDNGQHQMSKLGIVIRTATPPPPSLDSVVNAFDAYRLAELPADMLGRLAERAGVAKARTEVALMLKTRNGAKPSEAELLTVEQAATICNCSPAWVRRQALQNRAWAPFTHRLTRKAVLFDRDGLRAWLTSRRS